MDLNLLFDRLKNGVTGRIAYYERGKKKIKTYPEVYEDVARVGWALTNTYGLKKGSRAGIVGRNCYEWMVFDLACVTAGIITVPCETAKTLDLPWLFGHFGLEALFADSRDKLSPAREPAIDGRVHLFREVWPAATGPRMTAGVSYHGDEIFTVIQTSGTSGDAKAVEVKKKSFDHLVTNTQQLFSFGEKDRFLVFLPLSIYLERCYIYSAVLLGFSVILIPPELVFQAIQQDKPSVLIGIPYFFEKFHQLFVSKVNEKFLYRILYRGYLFLRKHRLAWLVGNRFYPFIRAWGGSIRILLTGAAPISRETLAFYQAMGIVLYEGYGMTEIGGMIALNSPGNYKLGSVGRPFPGKDVTIDADGQIIVRSDCHANTSYYNASAELNEQTYLAGNGVATGDLGYLDEDGFLYINGRIKNLIITSTGIKVHPEAVEQNVMRTGLFANCLVYGDNQPFLVALLVPKDKTLSHQAIRAAIDQVNGQLPNAERIVRFIVDQEPFTIENALLTPTLKINRRQAVGRYGLALTQLYQQGGTVPA